MQTESKEAEAKTQHTPGPWAWFGNARSHELYLATVRGGRRYVMGFQRWGMRGAQPIFQPAEQGLVAAEKLLKFEVGDRSVTGVEAAKADRSVYRLDIRDIDCADARLIAAAPDLLEALKEGRRAIGDHAAPGDCYATGPLTGGIIRDLISCPACSFIEMHDAAIAKATGQ